MATKLDATVKLATSTRYASPQSPGEPLPIVYGDMTQGGTGGLMRAVCIDTVNFVYCCADHACNAVTGVFDESGADITADAWINLASDYQGLGIVTIVAFTQPRFGGIYWRGKGVMSGGVLLTNPILCWQDFLMSRAGWLPGDFDTVSVGQAAADCDASGYQFATFIDQEQTINAWLNQWSADILADHWLDRSGRLVVQVETGKLLTEADLAGSIVASRDCVGGESGVQMTLDLQNVINVLHQYHLYHPQRGDYSSVVESVSDIGRQAYGELAMSLSYPTVRNASHLASVAATLFGLFDGQSPPKGAVLRAQLAGTKFIHLTRGDRVGLSWDTGPALPGDLYRNRILKVLNLQFTPPAGPIQMDALDTGQRLYLGGTAYGAGIYGAGGYNGGAADLTLRA